jgi:hypothetical protein
MADLRQTMRGKARRTIEQIESCRALLSEIQPASVRAVCYRLFVDGKIPSMAPLEVQRISRLITTAREEESIPWEWIVDETREVESTSTWADPEAFARTITRAYRKDKWDAQPVRVEVWSEKGTVRGTLAPVLRQFEVNFRVMHGFGSATAVHNAALNVLEDTGRPFVILYVGDWDPSGMYMSEKDLPERLTRYTGLREGKGFKVRRIALTSKDTKRLPAFEAETKRRDPRHQWYVGRYGSRCWELDAMSPVDLRERVDQEIRRLLDAETWNRYVRAEAAEQSSITDAVSAWRDLSASTG